MNFTTLLDRDNVSSKSYVVTVESVFPILVISEVEVVKSLNFNAVLNSSVMPWIYASLSPCNVNFPSTTDPTIPYPASVVSISPTVCVSDIETVYCVPSERSVIDWGLAHSMSLWREPIVVSKPKVSDAVNARVTSAFRVFV